MNTLDHFFEWVEERRDYFFEFVRIYLGVALFIRGLFFFFPGGREMLSGFLDTMGFSGWFGSVFWGHYVIMAHLAGGLFLAIGLLTRISAAIQIPILFGAAFFVHAQDGLFALGQSFELALLVLFLLVLVFVRGPGVLALDSYLLRTTTRVT